MLGTFGVIAVAGALIVLLGPVAVWAGGATVRRIADPLARAQAINTTRQTLLTAVGGTVALVAVTFTARAYYLSRRGQATSRFSVAIGHLASDKITERVGGAYELEHVMIDSAVDHATVVDVLATFVRERSPLLLAAASADPEAVQADVQAALSVLGRRPDRDEHNYVDLSGAALCQANLSRGRFSGAKLDGVQWDCVNLASASLDHSWMRGARLRGCDLWQASMSRAHAAAVDLTGAKMVGAVAVASDLAGAQLAGAEAIDAVFNGSDMSSSKLMNGRFDGASFVGANLSEADLTGASLKGADMRRANLTRARLDKADLEGALLAGALLDHVDLSSARNLTASQTAVAVLTEHTEPPGA